MTMNNLENFTFEKFISILIEKKIIYGDDQKEIKIEWTTGGITGGDCWGGVANIASRPEPEPEFQTYDDILLLFMPTLPHLLYKKLYNILVELDSYTDYGWYGNKTYYAVKKVELKRMYQEMLKLAKEYSMHLEGV